MPEPALRAELAGRPVRGPQSIAARVRLGASPATPADTLLALAADPAVTVRAAVAMNAAAPERVDRKLAQDGDERVRSLLAGKLARLIPGLAGDERERVQGVALAVLETLLQDEAIRVRAAIAEVVREMPEAPRDMILRLAHDAAGPVCAQVIRLSPLLTASDLLGLLAAAPSPDTARAVARRTGLSEAVSDAVAATADTGAIAALLANGSAAIRETTLDALIARAADRAEWHAPLVRRPVLSSRAARALSDIVAAELLDELAARADLPPELTVELRARLAMRLDERSEAARADPDIEAAMAAAHHLQAQDLLDEAAVIGAAQRGEARLATALLAVAAELGASVVDRAATLRSAKGIVSLVWKAGFSMRAAVPLQALLARLAPEALLRPTATGGFPLAVEEMRWQLDFLTRMGR
jgi:uncharacterized protein (DUF2336 family)